MVISIQLLGFNEKNSTKSLIEKMQPNDEDKKLIGTLINKHEDYLEEYEYKRQGITYEQVESEEYDSPFGVAELDYEYDVKNKCNVPVDDISYSKAEDECDLDGLYDGFALKKGSEESFFYLLNIFLNLQYDINLMDENFDGYNEESFKELIKEKQEKGMPVVVHFVFYINE